MENWYLEIFPLSYFSYLLPDIHNDILGDMDKSSQKKFLGITTLGEKGQIVIPAEARAMLKLVKGEKLVVVSSHEDTLVLMRTSRLEAMAAHFTKHLASVRKLIKNDKNHKNA